MPKVSSGVMQGNPYLVRLVDEIFDHYGWIKPLTTDDIYDLETQISSALKILYKEIGIQPYTIGDSTLRRLLGREKYDKSFDIASTLNPLAKLAGYDSWGYYLRDTNVKDYAELLPVDVIDNAETLQVGEIVKMGWYPIRYAELRYLGDCEFIITKYVGTGPNREGKTITGRWFDVVDIPAGPGVLEVTQDIAGVLGHEEYDRLYL